MIRKLDFSFPTLHLTEDRIFHFSLLASAIGHSLFIATLFFFHVKHQVIPKQRPQIVYHMEVQKPKKKKKTPVSRKIKSYQDETKPPQPRLLSPKELSHRPALGELKTRPQGLLTEKKAPMKIPSLGGKRQITVPFLKSEKISNPNYLNYNDRIRSKIENRAYFFVDDPDFESGYVYLTFILQADGELRAVKIIEEKTQASTFLRSVGLRSIKDSSPFPPFPRELHYPELPFNVIISFETGEE